MPKSVDRNGLAEMGATPCDPACGLDRAPHVRSDPGLETTTGLVAPVSNRLAESPRAAGTALHSGLCRPCRSRCGSAFACCRSRSPSS
jgi:hypothetical protein